MHDVLLQRTDLCVSGTYGTDGIRSIGWYEFRLWRTRRDNRSGWKPRSRVWLIQTVAKRGYGLKSWRDAQTPRPKRLSILGAFFAKRGRGFQFRSKDNSIRASVSHQNRPSSGSRPCHWGLDGGNKPEIPVSRPVADLLFRPRQKER